jgi:membrane-associated PAP2 superfamily phosphatase
MGLYQMLKGSHYLSHTVITMLLAWIGFLLWRRVFRMHRLPE